MELEKQPPKEPEEALDTHPESNSFFVNGKERWSPRFWANTHAALEFTSTEALDAAIDWLWTAPELREMPRVHVGRNTMIVPTRAVELFRQQGFQFTVGKVVSAGDLPAEEVNRIRRGG